MIPSDFAFTGLLTRVFGADAGVAAAAPRIAFLRDVESDHLAWRSTLTTTHRPLSELEYSFSI